MVKTDHSGSRFNADAIIEGKLVLCLIAFDVSFVCCPEEPAALFGNLMVLLTPLLSTLADQTLLFIMSPHVRAVSR
jgi:hypothetical protein